MVLAIDSGASDTIVLPSVCSLAPLHMTNKVCVDYEVANGAVITWKKRVQMKDPKPGKLLNMAFRVVDVHKPLLSASKITEQGHKVVFSKDESYIELPSGEIAPPKQRWSF